MKNKLFKVYVEAYIYADSEDEAKDLGLDNLYDKLQCGDMEVEETDYDED